MIIHVLSGLLYSELWEMFRPGVAKLFGLRAIFRNLDEGAGHTT